MFLDKVGLQNLTDCFKNTETAAKTHQILLWIILVQCERSLKNKISKMILDDGPLLQSIFSLLDNSASVVKGRIYLFIYFMLNYNLKKSLLLLDSKLFHIIERQGKDGAKYETQCLQFILVILY